MNRWIFVLIGASLLFLYSSVLAGLVRQWWDDDNYSHGLLIPFVVALIVWQQREHLKQQITAPSAALGTAIILFAFVLLFAGTLGAELFSQRISLVVLLAGGVVYFWGHRVLRYLSVPFVLLLLAIPIPQIILNKISFPLQLLATRAAQAGVELFGIPTTRMGNVIELVPLGGTTPVGLEVVEACSGIRSLVTLVTLAVVLGYLSSTASRPLPEGRSGAYRDGDLWRRIAILVALAVPVALVTNAARVLMTSLATYRLGAGVTESWLHDAFGWLTFFIGLAVLFALNVLLSKVLGDSPAARAEVPHRSHNARWNAIRPARGVALLLFLLAGGAVVNWFQMRTETPVARRPLSEFPVQLGKAFRPYDDLRFSPATEEVLGASDYLMRDYILPPRRFNLYVGYYNSKRTGATYHSPQHCLPGTGWEMSDGETIEIATPAGRQITANRYLVRNGNSRSVMIYWYQSAGRTNASEFWDKLHTIAGSISKGRSDGALVRIMTPIYEIETDARALEAAKNFSATIADSLTEYVPD